MNNKNRRLVFIVLILGLVACVCIAGTGIFAARYILDQGPENLLSTVSCAGFPDKPVIDDIDTQLDQIEEQVIAIRGLQPKNDVMRGFMTPEELRQRVTEDFFEDYTAEDARDDSNVLTVLGLLEPNFDLVEFYTELYSEQIAGFYDQETKEMYVIKDDIFGGPERMTYAHEYVHALQDQAYDIQNGLNYNDETCEEDSERCAAISALIEGDASSTERTWYEANATRQDCQEVTSFYSTFQSPVYDSAPEFMKQDFLFPYLQGKDFVDALIEKGGRAEVDEAYTNLPVSTEQILHPEKYPIDTPKVVNIPDLSTKLGDGWLEIDRGVMGEWYTYLILAYGNNPEARLEPEAAAKAAAGWGGDIYLAYFNADQNQTILVMQTTWENESEAQEFFNSLQDYNNKRFGQPSQKEQYAWMAEGQAGFQALQGSTTTWIVAPDEPTLANTRSILELP